MVKNILQMVQIVKRVAQKNFLLQILPENLPGTGFEVVFRGETRKGK